MKKVNTLIIAAMIATPTALPAQNLVLRVLDNFNVITGNYSVNGETEGKAFVSGTYTPNGSRAQYGFNSGAVSDDRTNVLWLNNGVSGSGTTRLLSGSVLSRTSVTPNQFSLNGNAANNPSINQGATAWNNALAGLGFVDTNAFTQTILSASSQWAALTANSTGSRLNNGSFTFNATPTIIDGRSVAVFDVTAEQLFGANAAGRIEANLNGAETLLINVSGVSATINQNFTNGIQNNEQKILFNFYEATSISINSNFRGGIYAPLATVNQNGSNIDGSVVAATLNQNAEIHNRNFTGYLPFSQVPEPSPSMLGLVGVTALLILKRRR